MDLEHSLVACRHRSCSFFITNTKYLLNIYTAHSIVILNRCSEWSPLILVLLSPYSILPCFLLLLAIFEPRIPEFNFTWSNNHHYQSTSIQRRISKKREFEDLPPLSLMKKRKIFMVPTSVISCLSPYSQSTWCRPFCSASFWMWIVGA